MARASYRAWRLFNESPGAQGPLLYGPASSRVVLQPCGLAGFFAAHGFLAAQGFFAAHGFEVFEAQGFFGAHGFLVWATVVGASPKATTPTTAIPLTTRRFILLTPSQGSGSYPLKPTRGPTIP